ncbi:MAG: hypothetical protein GW768_13465 [Sphingomonadales bacterium]|nr:hypothetical protein [Sphingomonadales bacterium]
MIESKYEDGPVTDVANRKAEIEIAPVTDKRGRAAFVDLGRAFSDRLENFVPQIRSEQIELVDPAKNPFFGHARVQLFIAKRGDTPVGRISAHIDELALAMPPEQGFGPGTGFFGFGFAWGLNNGVLEGDKYTAARDKAWDAMRRAVTPDGKLGWVQQIGKDPQKTDSESSQLYGVGGMLLFSSEMLENPAR